MSCIAQQAGVLISKGISRRHSVDENTKYSSDSLQLELAVLRDKLTQTYEENSELKNYVHQMNQECLELHADVFEEANKMVQDALTKQSKAETILREYASENAQLRKQIQMLSAKLSRKCSDYCKKRRNKLILFEHSQINNSNQQKKPSHLVKQIEPGDLTAIDSGIYKDFLSWLLSGAPTMSPSSLHRGMSVYPFLSRVIEEDIIPCLRFQCPHITQRLLRALPCMDFTISLLPPDRLDPGESCPLVLYKYCEYELIFQDINEKSIIHISRFAKNRIDAVCAFYNYVNSLCEDEHSLSLARRHEVFAEIQELRSQISLARLGFSLDFSHFTSL